METCNEKVEVYARIVGYFRPVQGWNPGKVEEFKQRVPFKLDGKPKPHPRIEDMEQ